MRVAQPSSVYEPRDPTSTVLYGIVRDHFETFRAHAASLRDGDGLNPRTPLIFPIVSRSKRRRRIWPRLELDG